MGEIERLGEIIPQFANPTIPQSQNPTIPMLPLLSLMSRPLPREPLGNFPSPLEWRPDLAARCGFDGFWLKRDDLNAESMGGNKVRALEWILPGAGSRVVTMGGFGSTHAAATSLYAAGTGRRVSVALFPQPWTPWVEMMLARTASHAKVELSRSRLGMVSALVRAWRGGDRRRRTTWIPAGAASPEGVLGSVNAALELIAQLRESGNPPPDVVVVPLGSGGTVAGLALGLSFSPWPVSVCAVPVTDRFIANRGTVRWLSYRATRLLRRAGVSLPRRRVPIRIALGHLGQGYGHPTKAGSEAQTLMAEAGISLDPCYGAKAFGALSALSGSFRRPCFWHTFDNRPRVESLEDPIVLRLARAYSEALWPLPRST